MSSTSFPRPLTLFHDGLRLLSASSLLIHVTHYVAKTRETCRVVPPSYSESNARYGSMDEDHLPVHITNSWTTEQRLSLLILYRFFSNSWREFGLIFDAAFRSRLESQGFINHPIPYLRVRTQWHDLMIKCGSEFSQVYEKVSFEDGITVHSPLYNLLQTLRLSAYNIGIQLRMRTHEDPRILKKFHGIRNRECYDKYFHRNAITISDEPAAASDNIDTPKLFAIPSADVPPLLFRCYDETSQGLNSNSGFTSTKSSPKRFIPDMNDPELLREVENHTQYWNQIPTAIISTTSSLIFAFKKARDCLQRGGIPQIVAIDTRALANCTRVYPAAPLCSQLRSEGRVKFRYRGAYEFLIWQSIPNNAILGHFIYSDLQKRAFLTKELEDLLQLSTIEDMSLKNTTQIRKALRGEVLSKCHGRAIAQLASTFRKDAFPAALWVADFVDVIIQNWRLKEAQPWREDTEFLASFHRGFEDPNCLPNTVTQSAIAMLPTPPVTPVKCRQTIAMNEHENRPVTFSSYDLPLQCQTPATDDRRTESTIADVDTRDEELRLDAAEPTWFDSLEDYLTGY